MVESKYSGYESYSYLRAGADYPPFELDVEIGRVPGHELGLGPAEHERAERLLAESIVISLHDHPAIFPKDMSRVRDYIRTAREHTGFRGLATSGMTAVFDNLMDGTACVTSKFGWKWDDIIYDLGMRLSDLAHQDFVVVAHGAADILAAHEQGRLAWCSAWRPPPRSRTRWTASTCSTASASGRWGSPTRSPTPWVPG